MFDNLKNAPALLPRLSDLVDEYNAKRAALETVAGDFRKAVTAAEVGCNIGGAYGGSLWDRYTPRIEQRTMESVLLVSAWNHVIDGLRIKEIATARDLDALKLAMQNPPEFTLDNIRATFGKYLVDPRQHVLRGVAEAFAGLDPAYRSHSKVKIGVKGLPKRIILDSALAEYSYGGYREKQLTDVLNAMATLHGEPRLTYSEVDALRKASRRGDDPEFYGVTLRGYQNGNCHLLFDDSALLTINRALAEFYGDALADDLAADETSKRPGTQVSAKLQYYPTPAEVVRKLVAGAPIRPGVRILEPSCGCGRILDGIRDEVKKRFLQDVRSVGVEYDLDRASQAKAKGHAVQVGNFLQIAPVADFDVVLMNPPFAGRHYLKHVRHALQFLKPGGYLACILPASAWYDHGQLQGGVWEDLPVASFAESGTNVPTGIYITGKAAK